MYKNSGGDRCRIRSPTSRRVAAIRSTRFSGRGFESTSYRHFWKQFINDLCNNLSFHGLNHFVDVEKTAVEKILWAVLVGCALLASVCSIREIWINYLMCSTETVVETTYYKNALIAFPAIVICQNSRVDWSKVHRLSEMNIPEYSNETEPAILALLKAASVIEFGNFDEFEILREYEDILPKLRTLRISDLLLKMMRSCDETFVGRCWWRSHEIDCCMIFELQKTEFGYCYSFNSDLSESGKKLSKVNDGINSYWRDPDGVMRPRRTGSRGMWSGLRARISTPTASLPPPSVTAFPAPSTSAAGSLLVPTKIIKAGIKILVGEPRAFFMGGEINVPAGQHGYVHVWGDRLYSTERLRRVPPARRHCLYSDEQTALNLPYYFRQNCKTECFKFHAYKFCNCSPDFMFFEAADNAPEYAACSVPDLLCLSRRNDILNNRLSTIGFMDENRTEGFLCDCKADCDHQMYITEATIAEESNSSQEVFIDVHFRQSTCILYRTDLRFGWLDLLVSFGGCTGLFLGGSLLSCFELFYFLTLRLYCKWRMWKSSRQAATNALVVNDDPITGQFFSKY